ncbi:MAG TPA: DUF3108 domain-containing protein [Gemmatimonadaceae bacterium]|nr:DUF3108 domain-containing protein [Gemmatimonadaceae bacterium]
MTLRAASIGGIGLAAALAASAVAGAQTYEESGGEVARRPFSVGERLVYAVRVGPLGRGNAVAEIKGVDTLRGREVYHSVFTMKGSLLFFGVNDEYESWFDPNTLVSLRYRQQIDQGSYERNRTYEIFPEKGTYLEPDKTERATVEKPLDDGAFLYFLRTMPLKVGKTYTFNRYFKPDRNPVTVTVVRKERIRVPAGEFDAVVLQPKIKAKGIFAEGARAEVWVADDAGRAVLQMKTHMSFGTVVFQLRSIENQRVAERP